MSSLPKIANSFLANYCRVFFRLRRSPGHGSVEIVVVVGGGGGVGTIFNFEFLERAFFKKITLVDNYVAANTVNFGATVTTNLAKNGQKRL